MSGEGELVAGLVGVRKREAVDDAERSGVGERAQGAEGLVAAHEVVGRGAGLVVEEPDGIPDDVGVGLVDGSTLRGRQDEPAVAAPEPIGVTRVGFAVLGREARRSEPRAGREVGAETERVASASAHGEVRHAVHQLVRDDVEGRERFLARGVRRSAVHVYAGAFRAEGRGHGDGVGADVDVDDAEDASVGAVQSLPAVSRVEVSRRSSPCGRGPRRRPRRPSRCPRRSPRRSRSRPTRRAAGR